MKKAVTRLLFGCLMFSLLLFTMLFTCGAQTPAMAASYLDIQDFCGEIYAYDCYGHRVDHEWFWQSPITIENPYFFPEIESIIFFPQVGKSYEYSRDRVHFFSLSKGMTISGIEDLIVQEVLSYNAVFVLEEDNLTIAVQQGGYLAEPPEAPVREGEVFLGWKEEGQDEIFDFETTPITQNYVFIPCY
ncbi:MAG: hypothetical protein PHI19_02115, partial [Clostridia bacterium]|nr:hypothetical protein [Clostridia bacterium]